MMISSDAVDTAKLEREHPHKHEHSDGEDEAQSVDEHARLDPPRLPSTWKRAAFVALLAVLLSLALYLIAATQRPPNVVHASRYSKEFKYRPAASPVITERLKDGRTRLRGALPTY